MKLLGKAGTSPPMNVDVNGFDATGIKSTDVSEINLIKPKPNRPHSAFWLPLPLICRNVPV